MAMDDRTERPLFPFSNDAVFSDVMPKRGICRRLIGRCVRRNVTDSGKVETQKEVRSGLERRSIRCDAFFEDADGVRYAVEMQTTFERDLPYGFRGYQSVIDASHWKPGEKFSGLGGSYVIFLCTHDPFGRGRPVYEIERCITGDAPEVVDTRAHWLALNASAWELEEEPGIRNLLRYIHDGTLPEGDGLLADIDEEVRRLNSDPEWRHKMITLEEKRLIHAQNLVDEAVEETTERVRSDDLALYEQLERAGRLSEYKRALMDDGFRKELESELGL